MEIIQMIFDRYIHTNDGINGVANYLNNHGYTWIYKEAASEWNDTGVLGQLYQEDN